jgi:hypothetical protein
MTKAAWGYSQCAEPDRWDGHCATREEAIAEARYEGLEEPFYVCSGAEPDPAKFMPDVRWIVEHMGENAGDNCGDIAEEYPDPDIVAEQKLAELLAKWARKHCKPRFWVSTGKPERIETVRP